MTPDDLLSVVSSAMRLATPLFFATLAGLFSERAGIVAIGLEGMMLGASFAAGSVAAATGSPHLALAAAVTVGIGIAMIHGYASIGQHGDQVVSGMALNIVAAGLTPTLALAWFGQGGATPPLDPAARFMPLHALDGLGAVWDRAVSGYDALVYLSWLALPFCAWVLFRTGFGLRLRAAGENPHAVEAAGLSVARLRYAGVALCGALAGLGGAYLSLAAGSGFVRDMVAGRGYLALAALMFGRWRPLPAYAACLLFALADALQLRLQGVALPLIGEIPAQFAQALPYVVTVAALALARRGSAMPGALGRPYVVSRDD